MINISLYKTLRPVPIFIIFALISVAALLTQADSSTDSFKDQTDNHSLMVLKKTFDFGTFDLEQDTEDQDKCLQQTIVQPTRGEYSCIQLFTEQIIGKKNHRQFFLVTQIALPPPQY